MTYATPPATARPSLIEGVANADLAATLLRMATGLSSPCRPLRAPETPRRLQAQSRPPLRKGS